MIRLLRLVLVGMVLLASPVRAERHVLPGAPAFAVAPGTGAGTQQQPPAELYIQAGMDFAVIERAIRAFQASYPQISIVYDDLNTLDLYNGLQHLAATGGRVPDLVISSAADLQVKMVNDGFAQSYRSAETSTLPAWSVWRNEAFGFSAEPAVIVYNRALLSPGEVPRSRWDFAKLLNDDPGRFTGKVITYDVARSGVGYLLATQDQKHSPAIWDVAQALKRVNTQLSISSREMLDKIASGDAILGYNILGYYAFVVAETDKRIGIILPEDYTLLLSRTAFIPRLAQQPRLGGLFLDFLLSAEGEKALAPMTLYNDLESLDPRKTPQDSRRSLSGGPLRPIRLGPGLLVYLDELKRRVFLKQYPSSLSRP